MPSNASCNIGRPERRPRRVLLAAATFMAMVGTVLSVTAPPAYADTPPVLSVSVNPDGSLHATWTMASDQVAYEFLYDTATGSGGKLTPTEALQQCSDGTMNCCQPDTWCYAAQGVPLYCYYVLYNDRTGDCPGHFDLADSDTSYDTGPLTAGSTYYVQVLVYNECFSAGNCTSENFNLYAYWSNVVQLTDNPPASTTTTAATTTTSTIATTTTTVAPSPLPAPAPLPVVPTFPSNGRVNCQANNYLVSDYDMAVATRASEAVKLRSAQAQVADLRKQLAAATGAQATDLNLKLGRLNATVKDLGQVIATLDAAIHQAAPSYQALKASCQKPTAVNPDPGQLLAFATIPPVPDNHTGPSAQLRPRVEYLRVALAKLYANKDFDKRFSVKNEVRKRQIETLVKRYQDEFLPKYPKAVAACS